MAQQAITYSWREPAEKAGIDLVNKDGRGGHPRGRGRHEKLECLLDNSLMVLQKQHV